MPCAWLLQSIGVPVVLMCCLEIVDVAVCMLHAGTLQCRTQQNQATVARESTTAAGQCHYRVCISVCCCFSSRLKAHRRNAEAAVLCVLFLVFKLSLGSSVLLCRAECSCNLAHTRQYSHLYLHCSIDVCKHDACFALLMPFLGEACVHARVSASFGSSVVSCNTTPLIKQQAPVHFPAICAAAVQEPVILCTTLPASAAFLSAAFMLFT
jgi:hypothetical protein